MQALPHLRVAMLKARYVKLNFFTNQYESLMKKIGKDELTEEDYERNEVKYHIMTCMKQALNAARSRNVLIEEGIVIAYLTSGINAAQAQAEVFAYLQWENETIKLGQAPDHAATVKWLEACADKWADCPHDFPKGGLICLMKPRWLTKAEHISPQMPHKVVNCRLTISGGTTALSLSSA